MPERKPRQRITFADKLARLDGRIARLTNIIRSLEQDRDALITDHRVKAEAMLKEAGGE